MDMENANKGQDEPEKWHGKEQFAFPVDRESNFIWIAAPFYTVQSLQDKDRNFLFFLS